MVSPVYPEREVCVTERGGRVAERGGNPERLPFLTVHRTRVERGRHLNPARGMPGMTEADTSSDSKPVCAGCESPSGNIEACGWVER